MSDLIKRLRAPKGFLDSSHHQAADELERKDAAIAELVGALKRIHDQPNCRYEVEAQLGEEVWESIAKYESKQEGK